MSILDLFETVIDFGTDVVEFLVDAGSSVVSTQIGRTLGGIAASIGLSLLADTLLRPKASAGETAGENFFTALIRAGAEPHRIFYGERLAGGVVTFISTTGTSNEFLHIVISVSGTSVQDLGGTSAQLENLQITLDGEVIGDTDANGDVITGTYSAKLRIKRHFGEYEQAADTDLVSDAAEWTSNHRLQDRAYIYVKLEFDETIYPNGIPNIQLIVRGRKLWDPRISTTSITDIVTEEVRATAHGVSVGDRVFIKGTNAVGNYGEFPVIGVIDANIFTVPLALLASNSTGGSFSKMIYSDNAALVVADYLTGEHGLDALEAEIDEADIITAADVCDEEVSLPAAVPTQDFTVDDLTDDILVQTVGAGLNPDWLHHLDGVEVSSTTTLPAGLSAATRYFVYRLSSTKYHLCTSLVNARAGIKINITDNGTGTHTLTRKSQPRYTINAIISRDSLAINVIPDMLRAMFGTLTYNQGEYHLFAGEYAGAATVTVDDTYLRAPLQVTPRPGIRNRFNGVRGTFVDRDFDYQNLEFIPVQDTTAETEDGQEIFTDIEAKYITDNMREQRLARLRLQRSRSARIAELKCNMKAQRIAAHDIIAVTIDLMNWSSKEFEVLTRTLAPNGRGIDLVCKEIFSTDFSFNPDTDITVPALVGIVALPGTTIAAPTNLALTNVEADIKVTWTDTPDASVLHYEVESKLTIDASFVLEGTIGQGNQLAFISNTVEGFDYDVRIRAVNRRGQKSAYITVTSNNFLPTGTGGELYAFGNASITGELGLGDKVDRSSPVQVGTSTDWDDISCGVNMTAALETDGALFTWGNGAQGRLGDGTTVSKSSPVLIAAGFNGKSVSAGGGQMFSIKIEGSLWGWGRNNVGQLGDGTTTDRSSPVQIGLLTNWIQVNGGFSSHCGAVKTDRTLFLWGSNGKGQLGNGTTVDESSPIQLGTSTDWKEVGCGIDFTVAIKIGGTLWSIGWNNVGQLGLGDTVDRSSPVQIGTDTNWDKLSVGSQTWGAIKIDGSLFTCGRGLSGGLGNGSTSNVSTPTQVGTLTNWDFISMGKEIGLAITTGRKLYAWGENSKGQLGQEDTTDRSSPVQVGTLINWKKAATGQQHCEVVTT